MHAAPRAGWALALLTVALAGCLAAPAPPGASPDAATAGCTLDLLRSRALGEAPCNVQVTTSNGPANEVSLALSPLDPRILVAGAKDYTLGDTPGCDVHNVWAGVYASADGGATWSNGLMAGHPAEPQGPLAGWPCSSDPVLAFGPGGEAYYTGLVVEPTPEAARPAVGLLGAARSAVWVARSDDGGASWGPAVIVAQCSAPACFHDKQWIAVGPDGTVLVTWALFAPLATTPLGGASTGHIVASRSTDRGATWSPPTVVSPPLDGNIANQGNTPVWLPDGSAVVVWIDFVNGVLLAARSGDGGVTWSPAATVAPVEPLPPSLPNSGFRTPTLTAAAATPDGAVLVAWHDYGAGHGDILLARSDDGGATWGQPVRVNQDEGDHDQFFPALDVAPGGRVDALFYDRSPDPGNRLVVPAYAWSLDGGATWQQVRVGDALFDGDLGYHQTGAPYLGDYLGLASGDDAAHLLWADTRHGGSDVFAAAVLHPPAAAAQPAAGKAAGSAAGVAPSGTPGSAGATRSTAANMAT